MHPVSPTAVTEHGPPAWEIGAWCPAWGGPRSVAAVQEKSPERVAKYSYCPFPPPVGRALRASRSLHPSGSPGTARPTPRGGPDGEKAAGDADGLGENNPRPGQAAGAEPFSRTTAR